MSKSKMSLNQIITKVQKMSNYGSEAQKFAKKHKLNVTNVTWEDNARNKNSCWGPCISDMTLQVNDKRMPVIRSPNYKDETWDVKMDKIPLVVGNESKDKSTKLKTVTLSEYLKNFDCYMTEAPKNKRLNLLRKNKDTHVIMSAQACFLPIPKGEETKFNVALYNYQSKKDNPAVLVIVSTSKGTSAQIIEGTSQKLLFNNNGIKADFLGQRLTDNRIERGVSIEGEMTKEEKQDNVILIIQIPLKQKQMNSDLFGFDDWNSSWSNNNNNMNNNMNSSYSYNYNKKNKNNKKTLSSKSNKWSNTSYNKKTSNNNSNCDFFGDFSYQQSQPQSQMNSSNFSSMIQNNSIKYSKKNSFNKKKKLKRKKQKEEANVESAIVKVSSKTIPVCSCGNDLTKMKGKYAYPTTNYNNSSSVVNCDICSVKCNNNDFVWHCSENKSWNHKDGYDLCFKCGNKQLQFKELNKLISIERDNKYPVRVTLQYYKSTDNGVVNKHIMSAIAGLLSSSKKQSDFVGSLVTEPNKGKRPTEWVNKQPKPKPKPKPKPIPQVNDNEYYQVSKILEKFNLVNDFLNVFKENEISDEVLILFESMDALKEIIPKLGVRMKIWKEIKDYQKRLKEKENETVDFIENLVF